MILGSIDQIVNDPGEANRRSLNNMKEYFDLPAETDPQRRLELTYLLLNEGMDKRNIQQQGKITNNCLKSTGTSHKRISDIFRIRYHRNNIKNYEKQKADNKERRHAFLMNKNSKSKKKIKVYNKTQVRFFLTDLYSQNMHLKNVSI